jgi:arylsulfatase A-like enzyme
MRTVFIVTTILPAIGLTASAADVPQDGRPNVLMISVDDMNDWISCLNDFHGLETPNFDRLAGMGQLFTNSYCAAPLCNPSRTALFTGMSPARTGIVNNARNASGAWKLRWPQLDTMPVWFKKHGYYVAGGGKTYHETVPDLFNPKHQWDEYCDLIGDKYKQEPHVRRLGITDRKWFSDMPSHPNGSWDWGPFASDDLDMGDGHTVRWAMDFLRKKHKKPFFLAVGLFQPHLPFYAPQKHFDRIPLDRVRLSEAPEWDLDDLPDEARQLMGAGQDKRFKMVVERGELKKAVRAYLACILHADALVGHLLETLDRSRYADNTIIVFWSDHGYQFGEKQRMAKRTLWRRATHAPLMMVVPGVAKAGSVCRQPASFLDVYPTLVELCGLPRPPHPLDGVSLAAQIIDPSAARRPAVVTHEPGNHAVCDDRWTYIRYRHGGEELYDRDADPHQWKNLAGETRHSQVKQRLSVWLPENQGIQVMPSAASGER